MSNPLITLFPNCCRLERFQGTRGAAAYCLARGRAAGAGAVNPLSSPTTRNYTAGDDFRCRYLDCNRSGRLDRLFLKLYAGKERELPVQIFLDASESMAFGRPQNIRFQRQIAAAIGYVALRQRFDRVSVIPVHDGLERTAVRGEVRCRVDANCPAILPKHLGHITAEKEPRIQTESLRRGALEARQAGVAIVLSDFLDPAGYEAGLTALVGRGFQVNAVQILAPEELAPSTFGDLRLVDAETGGVQEVTFGKYRLGAYQQMVQNFCQRLREYCSGLPGIHSFGRIEYNLSRRPRSTKQLRQAEVWG